jgi:hypothetical protein
MNAETFHIDTPSYATSEERLQKAAQDIAHSLTSEFQPSEVVEILTLVKEGIKRTWQDRVNETTAGLDKLNKAIVNLK